MTDITTVWMAARRRGLDYHQLTPDRQRTLCRRYVGDPWQGRYPFNGVLLKIEHARDRTGGQPCPRCWLTTDAAPSDRADRGSR